MLQILLEMLERSDASGLPSVCANDRRLSPSDPAATFKSDGRCSFGLLNLI